MNPLDQQLIDQLHEAELDTYRLKNRFDALTGAARRQRSHELATTFHAVATRLEMALYATRGARLTLEQGPAALPRQPEPHTVELDRSDLDIALADGEP